MITDDELLEKYNEIYEKIRKRINKIDSEPVHNEKYLRTKIKYYKGKINTKEGSHCISLSIILIDSIYEKHEYYYPQVFLEECKYFVKEKMSEYITH